MAQTDTTPRSANRTQAYLSLFNTNPIPNINGRFLNLVNPLMYQRNFEHFVELYLNDKTKPLTPEQLEWSDVTYTRLLPSSDGYQALERYSKTIYGGAVIGELVRDHAYYNNDRMNFIICQGSGASAKAGTSPDASKLFLPAIFPGKLKFSIGGQLIDELAIIHHEFHHTALWHGFMDLNITMEHERQAVIQAENPIRIMNGYEPRYVYYRSPLDTDSESNLTINIATGKIESGRFTFDQNDITKLVEVK